MADIPFRHFVPPIDTSVGRDTVRYPLSLRLLHWTRAVLVIGMLGAGWLLTSPGDAVPMKYGTLYPLHKSSGLLVLGPVIA